MPVVCKKMLKSREKKLKRLNFFIVFFLSLVVFAVNKANCGLTKYSCLLAYVHFINVIFALNNMWQEKIDYKLVNLVHHLFSLIKFFWHRIGSTGCWMRCNKTLCGELLLSSCRSFKYHAVNSSSQHLTFKIND